MTTTDNRELCGLAAAARLCLDEDVAAFDAPDTTDVTISRKESARILRLIRASGKRRSGRFGKAAACFLLVFSLLFAGAMCIEPVRAAVLHAILDWYDEYVAVHLTEPKTETPPSSIGEIILPDMPEGWESEEISSDSGLVFFILRSPAGQCLSFQQTITDDTPIWLDSTDCTVQEISLQNRSSAQLFTYTDGKYSIIWENRYTFLLTGKDIDLDILLAMAESINDKAEQLSTKK